MLPLPVRQYLILQTIIALDPIQYSTYEYYLEPVKSVVTSDCS